MEPLFALDDLTARFWGIKLCQVASSQDPDIDIINIMNGSWKIVWRSGLPSDPNFFYVAENADKSVYGLGIRGSVVAGGVFTQWDEFVDWILEDFNDEVVYWPFADDEGARIGAGSYVAFTKMMSTRSFGPSGKTLYEFLLENAVKRKSDVLIAGHSLGGNLAKVYASYFYHTLPQDKKDESKIYLVTLAAPASGNKIFTDYLNQKITRAWHYQNANDIVPHFPVKDSLKQAAKLYGPDIPDAALVDVTVKDANKKDVTLKLKLLIDQLADGLGKLGYQQPGNIQKITAPLSGKHQDKNSFDNWQGEVQYQHQLDTYINNLNVTLEKLQAVAP